MQGSDAERFFDYAQRRVVVKSYDRSQDTDSFVFRARSSQNQGVCDSISIQFEYLFRAGITITTYLDTCAVYPFTNRTISVSFSRIKLLDEAEDGQAASKVV